jgi:rhomboid protease GluP
MPLRQGYQSWLTGFEPVILEGRWWSPWSAQFVHAGPGHFLPNLAVIVYAGYRVERALGATAFLVVSASAVTAGGVLVALLSAFPVMGSSILGYGFLGALLTIGFRYGDTIPKHHRRFYGYGNLLLFALLFVSGLRMEQASHLGHLGGLLGGILAVGFVRPAITLRQPARSMQRKKNILAAVVLTLSPLVWVPVVHRTPTLAFGGTIPIALEEDGIQFELLGRLSRFQGRLRGLSAWALRAESGEAIFAGMEPIPAGESMDAERVEAFWGKDEAVEVRRPVPPNSLGPDWTVHALETQGEDGTWFRVVEHNLQRGQWLVRTGYRVRSDGVEPSAFRRALFGAFLETLTVTDPPALVKARHAWSLKKDAQTCLGLADQFKRMEDWGQMEKVLREIAERKPPPTRKARRRWNRILRDRLELWQAHPAVAPDNGVDWVQLALAAVPQDTRVQKAGILWLAANSWCNEAKIVYDEFVALRPRAAGVSGIAENLNEVCVGPNARK